MSLQKQTVTVVFVDIAGYSQLVSMNDELAAALVLRHFFDRVSKRAFQEQGETLKSVGDGAMLSFKAPGAATRFGLSLQESLLLEPIGEPPVVARVAIHTTDVYRESFDYGHEYYGAGINRAARLEALCAPGRVVVSSETYSQLERDLAQRFRFNGSIHLKGFEGEQEIWESTLSQDGRVADPE